MRPVWVGDHCIYPEHLQSANLRRKPTRNFPPNAYGIKQPSGAVVGPCCADSFVLFAPVERNDLRKVKRILPNSDDEGNGSAMCLSGKRYFPAQL